MLVLSRKAGESIVLGRSIEVFVLEVQGNRVRLGVQAPENVPVARKEIIERIAGLPRPRPAYLDRPLEVPRSVR